MVLHLVLKFNFLNSKILNSLETRNIGSPLHCCHPRITIRAASLTPPASSRLCYFIFSTNFFDSLGAIQQPGEENARVSVWPYVTSDDHLGPHTVDDFRLKNHSSSKSSRALRNAERISKMLAMMIPILESS